MKPSNLFYMSLLPTRNFCISLLHDSSNSFTLSLLAARSFLLLRSTKIRGWIWEHAWNRYLEIGSLECQCFCVSEPAHCCPAWILFSPPPLTHPASLHRLPQLSFLHFKLADSFLFFSFLIFFSLCSVLH